MVNNVQIVCNGVILNKDFGVSEWIGLLKDRTLNLKPKRQHLWNEMFSQNHHLCHFSFAQNKPTKNKDREDLVKTQDIGAYLMHCKNARVVF